MIRLFLLLFLLTGCGVICPEWTETRVYQHPRVIWVDSPPVIIKHHNHKPRHNKHKKKKRKYKHRKPY
tara:strand:- start:389 stop:592 length:204 start_codon:yes stop_codon:yes gene_type:complete